MAHSALPKTLRQAQGSQVLTVVASMGVAHSTALSVAIAEMIHVDGLSERFAESPRLARVIKLSKMVPLGYTPPNRKSVGGDLLDESFAKHVADNNKRIEANAEFEGLAATTAADSVDREFFERSRVFLKTRSDECF